MMIINIYKETLVLCI